MKRLITILTVILVLTMMLVSCTTPGSSSDAEPTDTPDPPPGDTEVADDPYDEPETSSNEPVKIGVSIMEMTAYTWFLGVRDGCEQWVADNPEANFTFQYEDSASDVSTMLNNIDDLITAGSKGIILFPADASSAIPTMKQSVDKGIPFIIGDYKQEPESEEDAVWSTFVGHDMRALGETAGQVAVEYLKTLGKDDPVCLFVTLPTSGQVTVDRYEGFADTILAEFPNAKIIEEGDTDGSRASAQDLVENILQREDTIDVVCGHNDAAVMGAYNAAVSQGRTDMKFIGIAGDKDILTFIEEGNDAWLAEVLQDPVVLGYQASDAIYKVLVLGEELPEEYELPQPEAITPENIKDYDWQNWAWL